MKLMAMFNISPIGNMDAVDMQKIKSYLFQLNEQLSYMFANLDPEENYSSHALIKHIEEGDKIAQIEASVDGIKLNMVNKGNIVSTINLSDEAIKIKAPKIQLEGLVTANGGFKIDENGTMFCKNANIEGTITSAVIDSVLIKGGEIRGELSAQIGDTFWIENPGGNTDYTVGLGGFEAKYIDVFGHIFGNTDTSLKLVASEATIYCREIYLDDPWMKGWGLVTTLKDIYSRIESLEEAE